MATFLNRHKWAFTYGAGLAAILLFLKWLEWRFLILDHAFEFHIGAIALTFTVLGIWLARKLFRPVKETIIIEGEVTVIPPRPGQTPDDSTLQRHGLSRREWEVLSLMTEGLSNQEIAERLFAALINSFLFIGLMLLGKASMKHFEHGAIFGCTLMILAFSLT